jgi:hypothetical protein
MILELSCQSAFMLGTKSFSNINRLR